jgi:hypothetical protein
VKVVVLESWQKRVAGGGIDGYHEFQDDDLHPPGVSSTPRRSNVTNWAKYSRSGGEKAEQTQQQVSFESLHSFGPNAQRSKLARARQREEELDVRRQLS